MTKIAKLLGIAAAVSVPAISVAAAKDETRAASSLPAIAAPGKLPMNIRGMTEAKSKSGLTQTVTLPIIIGGIVVGYTFYEVVINDSDG